MSLLRAVDRSLADSPLTYALHPLLFLRTDGINLSRLSTPSPSYILILNGIQNTTKSLTHSVPYNARARSSLSPIYNNPPLAFPRTHTQVPTPQPKLSTAHPFQRKQKPRKEGV